jgi:hypothetical protein
VNTPSAGSSNLQDGIGISTVYSRSTNADVPTQKVHQIDRGEEELADKLTTLEERKSFATLLPVATRWVFLRVGNYLCQRFRIPSTNGKWGYIHLISDWTALQLVLKCLTEYGLDG